MLLGIAELIGRSGGVIPFSAEMDFRDMEFGGSRPVTEPVSASGELRNEAGVLLLEGEVATTLHGVCDRCAKEFTRRIRIPIHAVVETDPDSAAPDDLWTFTAEDDTVDLDEIVRTAFVLGMDSKLLCKEDCKGRCFRCGADWNLGPCGCKPEPDPRFAALQQLLEKKE